MAGQNDRDQLVAQLSVGKGVAVLVAYGQQQGQNVVTRVVVGIVAAPLDLFVEQGIDAVAQTR